MINELREDDAISYFTEKSAETGGKEDSNTEIARLGGDVSSFVSPRILERLNAAGLGGEDALGGSSAHDRAHE